MVLLFWLIIYPVGNHISRAAKRRKNIIVACIDGQTVYFWVWNSTQLLKYSSCSNYSYSYFQIDTHCGIHGKTSKGWKCNIEMVIIIRQLLLLNTRETSTNIQLDSSDLGGQVRFRPLWERGCFDANAIL